MIYRIYIETGYRTVALDFYTAEDAGKFASLFLSHVNQEVSDRKSKLSFEVINPKVKDEDEDKDE